MARQKCVRTLIIVCSIAILATAITAFRLRDDDTDAAKTTKTHVKCDSCTLPKKTVSTDVANKKINKDQLIQKQLRPTNPSSKSIPLIPSDNDDSDDDGDDEYIVKTLKISGKNIITTNNQEDSKTAALSKLKKSISTRELSDDDNDDDEDDDDEDDDDDNDDDDDDDNDDDDDDTDDDDDDDDNDDSDEYDDDDDEDDDDDDETDLDTNVKIDSDDENNYKDNSDDDDDDNDDDDDDKKASESDIKELLPPKKQPIAAANPTHKIQIPPKEIKLTKEPPKPAPHKSVEISFSDDDDSDDDDVKPQKSKQLKKDDAPKQKDEKVVKTDPPFLAKVPIVVKDQTPLKYAKEPTATEKPHIVKVPPKKDNKSQAKIEISYSDDDDSDDDDVKPQKTKQSQKDDAIKQKTEKVVESKPKVKAEIEPKSKPSKPDKDTKKEKIEEKAKEKPKDQPKDNTKEKSRDESKDKPKDKPKDKLKDEPKVKPKDDRTKDAKPKDVTPKEIPPPPLKKIVKNVKNAKIEKNVKTKEAIMRKLILESSFDDFYTFLPTFAPNYSRIHNPECRRHGQIMMRQLHVAKLWALQMVDASAKIGSGILRGNGNQLGDFDECLDAKARVRLESGSTVKVRGRYCLAHIDLSATSNDFRLPVHLARGRDFIRSTNTDAGYFIPRFTSLRWGVCIPAACDARDAEFAVRDALRHYDATSSLRINVHVDEADCHTRRDGDPTDALTDPSTLVSLIGITFIVVLTIVATILDLWKVHTSAKREESNDEAESNEEKPEEEENKEVEEKNEEAEDGGDDKPKEQGRLENFSILKSWKKLLAEIGEDDIGCVYGIRALCGIALYASHKVISLGMTPYTNRIELTELANSPFSVAFRNAVLYTDTYLLLSGLLAAYHMAGDLIATGDMSWFKRFISRYIRLTPAMAAVIGATILMEYLGEGPQWGLIKENSRICSENMWRNLLYIQNFYDFDEMCAPQTHHLALDMQLTLLAAPLVWLMLNRATFAIVAIGTLHSYSAWVRYTASLEHNLSIIVYHGATSGQLLRTANFSYILPLHRATPYLAGVTLGVLLRQYGRDVQLSKLVLIPGWLFCAYFGVWAYYAPAHMAYRDYQYEATEMAQYSCLASIGWSLCLSWLIFACYTGNGGAIGNFLNSHPLIVISRLTFCMYLCQFIVFFYNVGTTRTAAEFTIISGINIPEMLMVLLVSVIFALLFDIPMQSLKKIITSLNFGSKNSDESSEETPNAEQQDAEEQEAEQPDNEPIIEESQVAHRPQEEEFPEEYGTEEEEYEPHILIENEEDIILEEEEEEEEEEIEAAVAEETAGANTFDNDLKRWRQRYSSNYQEESYGEEDDDLEEWEWTAEEERARR